MTRSFHFTFGALCLALFLTAGTSSLANDIQVTNVTLADTDLGQGITHVAFDIGWQNSWRGGGVGNWDAAWVFVKYKQPNGTWHHVNPENAGHTAPAGSQIDLGLLTPGSAYNAATNPVIGVFLRRDADGSGTFSAEGVQLRWDFGASGLFFNDISEVKVFAIEMVYVNQGAFAAGSGGTELSAFTLTTINTANATTAPSGVGSLGGQAGGYPTGAALPDNASWPNGFNAFYCMKYEMTQQQYVDFLNTLTYTQQVTRTATAPNSTAGTGALSETNLNRSGIDIQTAGVASTTPAVYACNLNGNGVYGEVSDGKDIACNFLAWGDLTAYLDWSGLRPMTELEFEKACRGSIAPVANEFPWGTTGVGTSAYTLANAGANNEGIATNYSTTLGNAICFSTEGAIDGPLRVGIFAANPSNNGRVTAGASYYGIMELGGNVWERAVYLTNSTGQFYTGLNGNGILSGDGKSNVIAWPGEESCGSCFRGTGWALSEFFARVSARGGVISGGRFSDSGGRGVRGAP